jgi:hypothetical protein
MLTQAAVWVCHQTGLEISDDILELKNNVLPVVISQGRNNGVPLAVLRGKSRILPTTNQAMFRAN